MKVRPISAAALFVFGIALTAGGLVRAVDDTTPRMRSHSVNETTQRRVLLRLETLATKLALTEDQKATLRPILESEAINLRALRMNTSITPEEQQAELLSIHERHRQQIRSVLTVEQEARLDELQKAGREKMLNDTGGQKRKGRVPVIPDTD
jgi:hypothetical protein